MGIGREHETHGAAWQRQLPLVVLDLPERQLGSRVPYERGITPVRHEMRLRVQAMFDERRERAQDVRVAVGADQPTNVVETDHLVDLAGDLLRREGRAGIDEHRLITVLEQIDVALEVIS